jgi:hypothetical protein
MKRLGLAAVFVAVAATAQAQGTDCPAGVPTAVTPAQQGQNAARDVCLRTKDVFQLLAPQLGAAITGGNAVLGQGGTLGGLGHFTVEARVNAVLNGDVPSLDKWPGLSTTTAPSSQELETTTFPIPMPTIDGALGIFKGLPFGVTNVGGIDLLASVAYIPTIDQDEIKITPESNIKFGYGARIGLLQESLLIPGLSATWMKRDLPTTTMTGASDFGTSSMQFTLTDASIKTTSWRLVASKSLIMFGLAAGYGQDSYDESASFSGSATVLTQNTTFTPFTLAHKMTRSNVFANASINLLVLKIVGEIGQVSGGELASEPFNTFSGGRADDSRAYASVGLRFSW